MMNLKKLLTLLFLTIIFPVLFYNVGIGLNLLLYNALIIGALLITKKLSFNYSLKNLILTGTILTAIFIVFNGSIFAIVINILSLFLLVGLTLYPQSRNIIYSSLISIINFFYAQYSFTSLISQISKKSTLAGKIFKVLRIIIIPLIVVIVFILIYRAANPIFEGLIKSIFDKIDYFFTWLFDNIEAALFVTIIFGFILSNYSILGEANTEVVKMEEKSTFSIQDKTGSLIEKSISNLKNEYISAIVLFVLLNILILVINAIDIWWVWFNFTWDGEYLKQFVHEGTYLLILSILISLAVSIYYFRGNINFLENNRILKILAYLWLFQNAILTISVGIRNYWYIDYFSLAYLRIGVIFFLILTLYSIFSVVKKIQKKRTTYYLFSKNSTAAYLILVVMAFFNWDVIIAKYNFNHSESSFIHYNFMADLSDNALPYLEKSKSELAEIDEHQSENFPFSDQYMSSSDYHERIQIKKKIFIKNWPNSCWKEWNWSSQRSYNKLVTSQ